MKKIIRLVFGFSWLAVALAVIGFTCYAWAQNGCSVLSLVASAVFYGSIIFGVWYCGDQAIKEVGDERK